MQAVSQNTAVEDRITGRCKEEQTICDLTYRYMELWTNHRIAEQSQLLAEDANLVNVLGQLVQGKSAIQQLHEQLHRTIFAGSRSRILELKIKLLDGSVAVVLARWEMLGAAKLPGWNVPDVRTGWMTLVWARHDDVWLIESLHNTDSIPVPVLPVQEKLSG